MNAERLLYNQAETCELINVSKATLYRLIRDGAITPLKIGSATRFTRSELERFIEVLAAQAV